MSSKSFAGGSVRSCAGSGSVRLGAGAGGARGPHELVLDALYERKRDKKTVRVLTVIVYVFCVSLAAIMLSLYYVFFWEPKDAQYAQRKVAHTVDQQTSTTPMPTCLLPHTGGGGVPVNVTLGPAPMGVSNGSSGASTGDPPPPPPGAPAAVHTSTSALPDVNGTDGMRVDNTSVT